MKILLVSSYLPYPLFSGGQVRLYNIIKELSSRHEITLVCERRPTETDNDIKQVEKICKKVILVPRKKQWSLSNITKAGISSKSFLSTGHELPEMREKIETLLQNEQFDLIHVETFYVMQNVPETKIPIVLIEHNIEYKVYERFKNQAPLPVKPLLGIDIAKIKREEESSWKRASKVVTVSSDDASILKTFGFNADIAANGVNVDQFFFIPLQKKVKDEKKILFIGDFKWIQNRDSAAYIIQDVWPLLKNKVSDNVKLWFVARNIPNAIRNLTDDPRVLFDEATSAKPTPDIFQEAAVLLAPIRVGGGTSYKILESMSCGTPVITMSLSANALHAEDEQELLVGNDAKQLAEKTYEVLHSKELYEKISGKGRTFIEKNYTWKYITRGLESTYTNVLRK